jgi:ribonuclease P protein component
MTGEMGAAAYTYPSSVRLRKRTEFLKLRDSTKKFASKKILVVWNENGLESARLGITVSKKVGNAVTRNRIKRFVREIFRTNRLVMPAVDLNVIARSESASLTFALMQLELQKAFTYIGIPQCSRASHS